MAVAPLSVWKSTLKALPKVADSSWGKNFANWYAAQILTISTSPSGIIPVGFLLVFNTALFEALLTSMSPTTSASAGIKGFADAWEKAIKTSVYPGTLILGPGSAAVSAGQVFSTVASVILTPASIAAGKAKIEELVSAAPVADADDSKFPEIFRDATLLLRINAIGTRSGPDGPLPLVASDVPLV